jgi:heme/copper-type cytochrome/quinol oxidase subunit 2
VSDTELRVQAPAPLRSSWLPSIAVVVALAAAVVGAVAGGVHSHVGHASTIPRLSTLLGYVAVATTVSVLVAGSVLFFILRPRRRFADDAAKDPPPGTRLERILIQLAMLALIAAPLTVVLLLLRNHMHRETGTQIGARPAIPRTVHPGSTTGPHIQWTFFLALVVGALVILAFVAVHRARRTQEEADAEPEDALEPVVAAGVEALGSERDPRRAVIKAYLAMERTLGEQGMPRRPTETPLEYLRRVLDELGAGAASARRLTSLFERAKFSRHTIDERMRQDALSDLAELRGTA